MKNKTFNRKIDKEFVVCIGTDIPVMSFREMMIFCYFDTLKASGKMPANLSFDEIFEDFTYTEKERFLIISRLIKIKSIKRTKINDKKSLYEVIPNMRFNQSKEVRIYKPKNKQEEINLKNEFKIK